MSDSSCRMVQFHDLVGLIDSKCAEIAGGAGELCEKDSEVINYLTGVKAMVIRFCEEDPSCPSYVFRC